MKSNLAQNSCESHHGEVKGLALKKKEYLDCLKVKGWNQYILVLIPLPDFSFMILASTQKVDLLSPLSIFLWSNDFLKVLFYMLY